MNLLEVSLDKLSAILGSDMENGLAAEQVLRNRREFGENVLFEKKNTAVDLFRKIFGDVMMILFLLVCIFDFLENGGIAALVVPISVCAIYSAFIVGTHSYVSHTKKRVERYFRTRYRVRRSGRILSVKKSELVPGDLLLLEKGDVMPCDGIILKNSSLRILEASVTGRRVPVFKRSHEEVENEESGYPYFECILFAGSVILQGSAKVFVCNTGKNIFDNANFTISRQNTTVPVIYETAMELKKQISMTWVLVAFLIFTWGVFCQQDVFRSFHYSIAIVIAAFPDAVEYLCDLGIAYMTRKMFREGIILRNPGALDRLCDANSVFVNSGDYLIYSQPVAGLYYCGYDAHDFETDPHPAHRLLENILLAQSSHKYYSSDRELLSTEKAILGAAAKISIQKKRLEKKYLFINSYDYDSKFGFSCVLVFDGNRYRLVIRGDLSSVLSRCDHILIRGEGENLNPTDRDVVRANARHLAGVCDRCVAVAELVLDSPPTGDQRNHCRGMTYVGMFGLSSPVSAAAANAVSVCRKSGVQTYLLTDDFPETVATLSKSASVIGEGDYDYALSYQSYCRIDRGIFVADLEKYKAFCGFPAEEKQSIVKYHKDNGNLTLLLSSGVYDSLPQMESDISVVGTEEKTNAVRLNADLLMKEKRFELIPLCINWARIFYRIVVHIMQYVLMNQFSLGFTVLLSLITAGNYPISVFPMIFGLLIVSFVSGMNLFHRKPGPRLEDNLHVLKDDRLASLRSMLILPLISGFSQALCCILSCRIALYASGSESVAANALWMTYLCSVWISSISLKFDSQLFRRWKEIGKSEGISFVVTAAIIGLLIFSPVSLLWQEKVEWIRPWPLFFALILAWIPTCIMEWIKALKKDDSALNAMRDS